MTSAANYIQYVLKDTITNAVKVFGPGRTRAGAPRATSEDEVKQDSQGS
jgi:hypothetical protein